MRIGEHMKKNTIIALVASKAIKYLVFVLLSFLIRGFIQFGANDIAGEGSFEQHFLDVVGLATVLLSYFSLTRSFAVYDTEYRARFFEGDRPRLILKEKVKFLVTSLEFWIEIAIMLAFAALLPLDFGYATLVAALTHWNEALVANGRLIPVLIVLLLLLLLTFFAHLSALNWWIASHRSSEKKRSEIGALLKAVLGVIGIYCFGSLISPIILSVFLTLFNVFGNITTLVILLSVVLLLLCLRYVRAFLARRRFLKQLVAICKANGFSLSGIDGGYRSLLFSTRKESFCVTRNGQTYACKLICGIRKMSPMYLDEHGNGKTVHSVTLGKFELFQYVNAFQYAFDSANQKIIIINPIPQSVSFWSQGRSRPIDTGERIKDYHIYNATGFLNALERDCLCK